MDRAAKDPSPETIEVLSTSRWNCYDDDNEILDATGLDLFSPDEVENDKQRGSSEEKDSDLAPCPPGPPPLAIETKIRSIHISPPTVPPPGSAHSHFGHNLGSDPGNGDCVLKKISSLGISKKS